MVAGLFDAYKDFGFDVFRGIREAGGLQPLKLAVVPTQHEVFLLMHFVVRVDKKIFQFPWESSNTPLYDDRVEMLNWFKQFLGQSSNILSTPEITIFLRDSALPSSG